MDLDLNNELDNFGIDDELSDFDSEYQTSQENETDDDIIINETMEDDQEDIIDDADENISNTEQVTIKKYQPVETILTPGEDYTLTDIDDQTYVYKNIKDPSGEKTNYFSCHYKVDDEKYNTFNTCISKTYKPILIKNIIESIKQHINIENEKSFNSPFFISWIGDFNHQVKINEDYASESMMKFIFGSSYTDEVSYVDNKLTIAVLNTYNAKSSIILDFVINMNLSNGTVSKEINDYFTLGAINVSNFHKGSTDKIGKIDYSNVENMITNNRNILEKHQPKNLQAISNNIAAKFRGDVKRDFLSTWSDFPDTDKNMFTLLYITSIVLSNNYTTKLHFELRKIVERHTKMLYKEMGKLKA